MHSNSIYILHKSGAKTHYTGLDYLAKKNGLNVVYREFSIFSKLFKSLKKLDFDRFFKQFVNMVFLLQLLFSKNKKVVLSIAPFDYKLKFILWFLENHNVYYHTSWACWDKNFHPKKKRISQKVYENWKRFLEQKAIHIFCVNQRGKEQLLENYALDSDKISVVQHAMNPLFSNKITREKIEGSFIYYGRLVPQKGIEEMLNYFAENKEIMLTVIGKGNLQNMVEKYSKKNKNIIYKEEISNVRELKEELAKQQYLILNSKKNAKWEELFGLVIIESMSQGVIPIATNHPGPREIISRSTGFLYEEGELKSVLEKVRLNNYDSKLMAENCILESKLYFPENIAEKWKAIL